MNIQMLQEVPGENSDSFLPLNYVEIVRRSQMIVTFSYIISYHHQIINEINLYQHYFTLKISVILFSITKIYITCHLFTVWVIMFFKWSRTWHFYRAPLAYRYVRGSENTDTQNPCHRHSSRATEPSQVGQLKHNTICSKRGKYPMMDSHSYARLCKFNTSSQ